MSSWRECKLGDILEEVIDNRGRNPEEYTDFGIPVIDNFMIKNQKYINLAESKRFLDDETFKSFIRKHIQNKDVLITLVGNGYGNISQAPKSKAVIIQNTIGLRCNGEADNDFLFYCLKFNNEEILNFDRGAVQPSIKVGDLKSLEILLPPLEEQKAIAEVLSSLDDKIDLLHRQNQTLESLAQTLFRQWFIEEAKEEWEEVLITDLFEVRDGTHDSPKQKEFGKKLLTSKHILKNKLDFESSYFISEEDFEKINQRSIVEQGDILFSMIGTIGLTYLEQSNEIDYAIKNIGLFKTSQNKKFMYFVYLWLNSSFGVEFIHENRSGSTQEYISLGSLRNIIFNLPNYKIIDLFNEKMEPIFEKINTNMKQIKSLENLRDTLLPKLFSGEIKIKD